MHDSVLELLIMRVEFINKKKFSNHRNYLSMSCVFVKQFTNNINFVIVFI